jgi:hypothetical protein
MTDLYLKATTRAALVKKLVAAGLMVDDLPAEGVLLDEIGAIEGVTGFHANVRLDATEEQIAALGTTVVAEPATPYRVWA